MTIALQRSIEPRLSETTHATPIEPIEFASSDLLTLGIEIEIQLIDTRTMELMPRAPELLASCAGLERLEPEFFQSTIELKTGICRTVHDAEETLAPDLATVTRHAAELGIDLCTTGCHPFARYTDCHVTDTARYRELIDRHQWLTRRMTVYGLHFHLGMPSGADCIKYQNSLLSYLPHLLALSASSPYWQGQDTGLASCRPTTYDALPTAGQPYPINDWGEYEELVHVLRRSKAIGSLKDLWWDIRPSPQHGTLEIRCCDGPATLAEALAIAAFVHLLALHISDRVSRAERVAPPPRWMLRENKWRAIRHGLDASIVTDHLGSTRPLREDIGLLIGSMQETATRLGYTGHIETLQSLLAFGNSSARQRRVFERTRSMTDLVSFNIEEFRARRPIWD